MFITIFLTVLHKASATEPFFGVSVGALISKANQTGDISFLGRAGLRCSALLTLSYQLFKRDFPSEDWSHFEVQANAAGILGIKVSKTKSIERGLDSEEQKQAQQRTLEELSEYMKIYSDWMQSNYFNQGEYFGSSPALKADMETCVELAKASM